MKILITGVGITGKSSLRRGLVELLRRVGLTVKHYDVDRFEECRHPADVDCSSSLFNTFDRSTVYIIEDIHGPLASAALPLASYDLILYVQPDILSHLIFWFRRAWTWYKIGKFSWDPEKGWKGTGKAYDPYNIAPVLRTILLDFKNRRRRIKEDLKAIAPFSHVIIRSQWAFRGGIKFTIP